MTRERTVVKVNVLHGSSVISTLHGPWASLDVTLESHNPTGQGLGAPTLSLTLNFTDYCLEAPSPPIRRIEYRIV